jgi:hypothetical protein
MKKSKSLALVRLLAGLFIVVGLTGCLNLFNSDSGDSGTPGAPSTSSVTEKALFADLTDHGGITVTMEAVAGSQTSAVSQALTEGAIGASAVYAQAVTGSDGSYLFTDVAPGTYTLYASCAESLESAVEVNVVVEANTTLTVDDLYLTPVGSITGIALLSGVAAGSSQGIIVYLAGTSYVAITDGFGNYTISGVPEGTGYTLVASMDGFANSSQTVSVAPLVVTEPAPITLTPGSSSDTSPPVIKSVTHIPQPARVNSPTAILVDAQDPESILTLSYDTDSDGGTATATHQITVSTALPDQTTPQIQSITHTPLEVRTGDEVTIVVTVVPDDFTPTITYDTDNDGEFDDPATVTYASSGIKPVGVRVETAGGATQQTHYVYVLPPGAGYLTISGAAATSDTTPTWTWNVPTEATNFRYRLDRIATPNEEIVAWTETGGTGTTGYTSAVTLTVGESYLFTVEGYDGADWSYEASRTTLIKPPSVEYAGSYSFDGSGFDTAVATWEAGGYTSITGSIYVSTEFWTGAAVTDLSFLAGLTEIGGDLTIGRTRDLVSLAGLDDLIEIGGTLKIGHYSSGVRSNDALTSLAGLEKLQQVGGDIAISYNPVLQDIAALSALRDVGGSLAVAENADLLTLSGLQNLDCQLTSLSITDNDSLQDISSLAGVSVNGVYVRNNPDLGSLTGLQGVRGIGSGITIDNNDAITSVTGLESLGYVTDSITIRGNDDLATLDGLGVTGLGGSLTIEANDSLTDIGELSDLTILSSLYLYNNDGLPSLDGLDNLTTATGSVTISGNELLQDLSALDLVGVGGSVDLANNGSNGVLLDYSAGGGCSFGNISGNLTIRDHNYLLSLDGISVEDCAGDLSIYGNNALSDISALGTLSRTDDLRVYENPALHTLDGLDGISLAASISIYNNAVLTDLSALSNTRVTGNFRIYSLSNLTNFAAGGGLTGIRVDGKLSIGYCNTSNWSYYGNPSLASLAGLSDITLNATGAGQLEICANQSLNDISALSGEVTGLAGLRIDNNTVLENLTGLDSLTSVTGSTNIQGNGQLDDLTALGGLSVTGNLSLYENDSLSSLAGLENVSTVGNLWVQNNDSLVNLATGAEETDITVGTAAAFVTGDYFTFDDGTTLYDVWFNVDSGGGYTGFNTPVPVTVAPSDTATEIATATAAAIAGSGAHVYVSSWDEGVFLMNDSIGEPTDALVTQTGTGISLTVTRQGTFTGTGLVGLSDVTDLRITHLPDSNSALFTLGLVSLTGDTMDRLWVTDNDSLNRGKAERLVDRNSPATYSVTGNLE